MKQEVISEFLSLPGLAGLVLTDQRSRPYASGLYLKMTTQQRDLLTQGICQVLASIPHQFDSFEFQFYSYQVFIHRLQQGTTLMVIGHEQLLATSYATAIVQLTQEIETAGDRAVAMMRLIASDWVPIPIDGIIPVVVAPSPGKPISPPDELRSSPEEITPLADLSAGSESLTSDRTLKNPSEPLQSAEIGDTPLILEPAPEPISELIPESIPEQAPEQIVQPISQEATAEQPTQPQPRNPQSSAPTAAPKAKPVTQPAPSPAKANPARKPKTAPQSPLPVGSTSALKQRPLPDTTLSPTANPSPFQTADQIPPVSPKSAAKPLSFEELFDGSKNKPIATNGTALPASLAVVTQHASVSAKTAPIAPAPIPAPTQVSPIELAQPIATPSPTEAAPIAATTASNTAVSALPITLEPELVSPSATPPVTIPSNDMVAALNKLSRFTTQYLGNSVIVNYWKASRPKVDWLSGFELDRAAQFTPPADISPTLTDEQQEWIRDWVGAFIKRCSQVIRDFPTLVNQQGLAESEKTLLL